jgi:hypothetical protein
MSPGAEEAEYITGGDVAKKKKRGGGLLEAASVAGLRFPVLQEHEVDSL